MSYYNENNPERTSKYNAALQQIYRLDKLWNRAHNLCLTGKFKNYKFVLDRVWIELGPDAIKEQTNSQKEINRKLNEILSRRTMSEDEAEKTKMKKEKKSMLYSALMDYEIFLRKVQNSQGKGTAYRDLAEESI